MDNGYTANFGMSYSDLSTVKYRWVGQNGDLLGSDWSDAEGELVVGTGIYYIYEDKPADAYWLAWKTGGDDEKFLVLPLKEGAFLFAFQRSTGLEVTYRFIDGDGAFDGDEVVSGVTELFDNLFIAYNGDILDTAVFVRAKTVEASPKYVAGTLDDVLSGFVTLRGGPYTEEVVR